MATIDMTNGTAGFASLGSAKPVLVERYVNMATAITTKGSALASGDVIECIDLPKGTIVLAAGAQVDTVFAGTSTDTSFELGITGGDIDRWVDAFDFDGAAVNAYATQGVAGYEPFLVTAADTMDWVITAMTGTCTAGVLRTWAVIMDVNGKATPGIANPGDVTAGS